MAAPFKSMDDESTNNGGPVDPSMARFIRAEVQAALKGVQETFSAPPSYDSSAPLLSSSPTGDDVDTEAQQEPVPTTSETPPPKLMTFLGWVRFIIAMSPFFTFCSLWIILIGTGVDPLGFSLLAIFLGFGEFAYTIFVILVHERTQLGKKDQKASTVAATEEGNYDNWKDILAINCGILGLYLIIYGIICVWSVMLPTSLYNLYQVSRDFQAKIDAPGALSVLAGCLQKALPDRNATIADVSTCLKLMGMNESFVE